MNALLFLEDRTEFKGKAFGYEKSIFGELVFNTTMTGYPKSLTDPSYKEQLLVATYPLIGNYGVLNKSKKNDLLEFYESDSIQDTGLVISKYSHDFNQWNADKSFSDGLVENKIHGIYTRLLTPILREKGAMLSKIIIKEKEVAFYNPNKENLVDWVSVKDEKTIARDWQSSFINLNDQTNEGLKHKTKPFFSTQFHPEASGGPTDSEFLFDNFFELVKASVELRNKDN